LALTYRLRSHLEEAIEHGDKVVVAVRTPGADAYRVRQSDDSDYATSTYARGESLPYAAAEIVPPR
jgi:hypothetical protein